MIIHTIFIIYFSAYSNRFSILYSNWFSILYSDRGSFIVSLEVENEGENIEIATGIENRMKHRLELVFSHIL
jgi:hypothetical protein